MKKTNWGSLFQTIHVKLLTKLAVHRHLTSICRSRHHDHHPVRNHLEEAVSVYHFFGVAALLILRIRCFYPPLPPPFPAGQPFPTQPALQSRGASRTRSRAASRGPAEDREIGMINNCNYWQTCQLLCGNGHL